MSSNWIKKAREIEGNIYITRRISLRSETRLMSNGWSIFTMKLRWRATIIEAKRCMLLFPHIRCQNTDFVMTGSIPPKGRADFSVEIGVGKLIRVATRIDMTEGSLLTNLIQAGTRAFKRWV